MSQSEDGKPGARTSKAAMDSEITGQLLERAALELLERDGVLAGLNLREVAERAGVNRGLVYHYFGSRRDLLRSALRRTAVEQRTELRLKDHPSRFADRMAYAYKGCLRYASAVRLTLLLVLDGDKELTLMPLRDYTQERLREDVDTGMVAADSDPIALHTFLKTANYGYLIARTRLAKEFGIGVKELDERYGAFLAQLCAGLDGPAAVQSDD